MLKKGHPFMLQIPMLRAANIKVGEVFQVEGSIPPFKIHSITSIEFEGTKTILGFAAKEDSGEKRQKTNS